MFRVLSTKLLLYNEVDAFLELHLLFEEATDLTQLITVGRKARVYVPWKRSE